MFLLLSSLLFFSSSLVSGHIPGQSHHGHDHGHPHAFMGPMMEHHHRVMVPEHADMSHHPADLGPNHTTTVYNNNQYNSHDHDHHAPLLQPNQHHAVHHVSHSLPGGSMVAIQRFYVAPPISPSAYLQRTPATTRKPNPSPNPNYHSQPAPYKQQSAPAYPTQTHATTYHTQPQQATVYRTSPYQTFSHPPQSPVSYSYYPASVQAHSQAPAHSQTHVRVLPAHSPAPAHTPIPAHSPIPAHTPVPVSAHSPVPVPPHSQVPVPAHSPVSIPAHSPAPAHTPVPVPAHSSAPIPAHAPVLRQHPADPYQTNFKTSSQETSVHTPQQQQLRSGKALEPSSPAASNAQQSTEQKHHPFEPRFQVDRLEVSDSEWEEEIRESFASSGLLPGVLTSTPTGLVNVNFGTHNCVHMGTDIEPEISAYEPSAVSWPANDGSNYTLVMLDVDNGSRLHWLVSNIPGSNVTRAETIAEYDSPAPGKGTEKLASGSHRYVLAAMEQTRGYIQPSALSGHLSDACDAKGRTGFGLAAFRAKHGLAEPSAANYFTVRHSAFVDSIVQYCEGKNKSASSSD